MSGFLERLDFSIPKLPLGKVVERGIDYLTLNLSGLTDSVSDGISWAVDLLATILLYLPGWMMVILFTVLAYVIARRRGVTVFTFLGLAFVWNLGLWEPTMRTLALVLFATIAAIAIGIPLGILGALSKLCHRIIMPILDFMQTLPAFVYLIPAISFFGLGETAGLFATIIFAMPPAIRLTDLGIKQVPGELIEASDAFGSTTAQKLIKLQLPLALPSIRAGVNQTIMLALSMVVIAGMIGAKGLGTEVWKAIQRLQTGRGFEAGICIVILAIVLDRIMHAASDSSPGTKQA